MENDNSLSVIYAIHMKMNDRSESRVSNFNVYTDADNRERDKKQRRESGGEKKKNVRGHRVENKLQWFSFKCE